MSTATYDKSMDLRRLSHPVQVKIADEQSEELQAAYARIEELKVTLRLVRHELTEGEAVDIIETCIGHIDEALDEGVVS